MPELNKYILFSQDFIHASLENSGVKAYNLIKYGLNTPDFLIITNELYSLWLEKEESISESESFLRTIISYFVNRGINSIIVRSSAVNEQFGERGLFVSEICKPRNNLLLQVIIKIYEDFKKKCNTNKIALLIQEYKEPIVIGHLSNERRVTPKKENWFVEKEIRSEKEISLTKFRTSGNEKKGLDYSIYSCLNIKSLNYSLESIASFFCREDYRFHIEWLWDGKVFWILQIDEEINKNQGIKPGSEWIKGRWNQSKNPFTDLKGLEVFETIETSRKNWPKISCIKSFRELELPFWQIFILENESIIESLFAGHPDLSLISDLKNLLTSPIVIRSDVRDNQELLLARTDTIFNLDSALEFLISESQRFINGGLRSDQFCFLIHKFIVSVAGALAYAKPNLERVRIDSTWGIVDGLYFYPHDSYEVDIRAEKIAKKLRCKHKYVDFDENGTWYAKEAGINFDWRQSITDYQISQIATMTQSIVDKLEKPTTVMFFINKRKGLPEVLPWFYSIDEIYDSKTDYTDIIFSEKKIIINSKDDFYRYKDLDFSQHKKNKLKLCLDVDLLRDKDFIEEIADFAKENDFVVDMEGSILSHPYYVLRSKGVVVRCFNPLDISPSTKEFYKLVRDQIPIKIESQNETVISTKVLPGELLNYLKEKAIEEAFELYWSRDNDNTIEELSDLFEVIIGVCKAFGIELKEIEKIAEKKRQKRGGFNEGVYLIATKENSLFQLTKPEQKLFSESSEKQKINVPIKPVIKFFQKGQIRNLKSLSKVDKFELSYINNYNSLSNKFKYLLKDENYNGITIEYKEKCIKISLEKIDFSPEKGQMDLFKE
ncbi:MAG: nucleoside triphosphate pyrophosphohydrolase [Bacteroidales bacterium]|nr:nucleoside triphosphate pyrophosphohydrolase [Bacteroidales bacterium]